MGVRPHVSRGSVEPHQIVTVGSVLVLATTLLFEEAAIPLFVLSVLLAMTVHILAYERGRDQAAVDFAITVAGIVYLGWLGSYLLDCVNSLRAAGG